MGVGLHLHGGTVLHAANPSGPSGPGQLLRADALDPSGNGFLSEPRRVLLTGLLGESDCLRGALLTAKIKRVEARRAILNQTHKSVEPGGGDVDCASQLSLRGFLGVRQAGDRCEVALRNVVKGLDWIRDEL